MFMDNFSENFKYNIYRNTVEILPLFPSIEQNLQIAIKIKRGIRKNESNSKATNYTKVNKLILLTEFFCR